MASNAQPGIPDDTAHRYRIDRIVPRDGENPTAITHYHVLALAQDDESGLFERPNSIEMVDAGKLGQASGRYFHDTNLLAAQLIVDDGQVLLDGNPDVLQRLRLGAPLRPTAW